MHASASFTVALHDVTPVFERQIDAVLRALEPLVGTRATAAAVPSWHERGDEPADEQLWSVVRERFDETLLHGLHHHQPRRGVRSLFSFQANEFSYLSVEQTSARLALGQRLFAQLLGERARGFLPPAYARGALTREALAEHGLEFCVGMTELDSSTGHVTPLSTWIWDCGPLPGTGYLAELAGHVSRLARPRAVPCLAFHPIDVDRGLFERGLGIVRKLLERGCEPCTFASLLPEES